MATVPTYAAMGSAARSLGGSAAAGTAAQGFMQSLGTTALPLGMALQAGAGLASGIGNIAAARAMRLTADEERELEELRQRRQAGQMGLTEAQEGRLEQQFATRRGGMLRQQQATALQQAAQAGPVSGRDVFLREQAQQAGQTQMLQQENLLRAQADAAAAQEQEARLQSLQAQEKQAKAAIRQAVAGTVAGVLGAPVEPLQTYAMLSATGKISPYAGRTEAETFDAAGLPPEEDLEDVGGF
jgi:hypothetical protein